jgi:hypothetical protein
MCIDNSKLKTEKVGNGTMCRVRRLQLKRGSPPLQWKNWDGKKVYTVNARHVEYIEMERFPLTDKILELSKKAKQLRDDLISEPNQSIQKQIDTLESEITRLKKERHFRLSLVKTTTVVDLNLDDSISETTKISGVVMTQLPIMMNDATTGHKLQGMSKDYLIVVAWIFVANWVYVVLSRVRTLQGLFLFEPLPDNCLEKFNVPRELQAFERRMQSLEQELLKSREQYLKGESNLA